MTEKIVHFNLYRPDRSLFKSGRNERAQVQIITCSNSDNCQLLARNECACRYGLYSGRCPYGRFGRVEGYTRRARKYSSWCSEQKNKYDGIGYLDAPEVLGSVGDYVFLPYAYMDMLKSLPWEGNFLSKESFTVENIVKLVEFIPKKLFGGGAIESYQDNIPTFLKHLSEYSPKLFEQVIAKSEHAAKRYREFSNVGRHAILETLTPNTGLLKDIHGGEWIWDGKKLHSKNSHMSFGICKFSEVSIVPLPKQVVKVTDEKQVNQNTIIKD